MVTYEQLFDTLRREKSRDELQVLEDGFYPAVKVFLRQKEDEAGRDGTMTAQKARIEYQNTQRIIHELYDRRERKILTLAMHKIRTQAAIVEREALQPEEHLLFDDIVARLLGTRSTIFDGPVPDIPPPVEEPEELPEPPTGETVVRVTFSSNVPKFVGKDMTMYGPFEQGDSASLPESVAKILVEKGRANTS